MASIELWSPKVTAADSTNYNADRPERRPMLPFPQPCSLPRQLTKLTGGDMETAVETKSALDIWREKILNGKTEPSEKGEEL